MLTSSAYRLIWKQIFITCSFMRFTSTTWIWMFSFLVSRLYLHNAHCKFVFLFQVGVAALNPMRRSYWGSANDWSRMLSIAHCNSTNRRRFKTGAGLMPRQRSPPGKRKRQKRTLRLTPSLTTGSDITGQRYRDWKEQPPRENISWRRGRTPWAQSLNLSAQLADRIT